jgi:hypothetical protein
LGGRGYGDEHADYADHFQRKADVVKSLTARLRSVRNAKVTDEPTCRADQITRDGPALKLSVHDGQ